MPKRKETIEQYIERLRRTLQRLGVELDDLEAETDRRAMRIEEDCKLFGIPPEKLNNDQDDTKPIT